MLRRAAYVGGGVTAVAGIATAVFITANDDWPLLAYKAKKVVGLTKSSTDGQPRKKVVVLGTGWGALSLIQQLDQDKVRSRQQLKHLHIVYVCLISHLYLYLPVPILANAHFTRLRALRWT
jgi:hypothetical protein